MSSTWERCDFSNKHNFGDVGEDGFYYDAWEIWARRKENFSGVTTEDGGVRLDWTQFAPEPAPAKDHRGCLMMERSTSNTVVLARNATLTSIPGSKTSHHQSTGTTYYYPATLK
jgi:hypothetical protein